MYGTSPGNQRIEAWWSFLRRNRSQWWIELFESLVEFGAFHPGNIMETDCLRFCFMSLFQHDLHHVRRQWNIHRIRPSAGARCPPGIPDELYFLPHPPAFDCLTVSQATLSQQILDQLQEKNVCADQDFFDYLVYICNANGWSLPDCIDDATR